MSGLPTTDVLALCQAHTIPIEAWKPMIREDSRLWECAVCHEPASHFHVDSGRAYREGV